MHDARQKRSRRTKEQMDELLAAVQGVLDNYDGDRISVRHLCYRLASVGVIAKTERELSGELSFGEYGIRRLKQDIGPPKATPERLTRAKQIVRLAVDKPSLRHPRIARKSIPQAARHAFVGELASEFEQWLGFALAGQQASKQLSSLNSILSAMRLLKRRQLRRRRERRHP